MDMLDDEFLDLVMNFLDSSKRIRDAAELCDGDSIKQDMIHDAIKDFNVVSSRSEALRLMTETNYTANRDFVLKELKELTTINNKIAQQIEDKLKPLVWN